jgi:hypothetical protein
VALKVEKEETGFPKDPLVVGITSAVVVFGCDVGADHEELSADTSAWYAGTRAKVEARAALEQAEERGRALEELGERLGK